MRPGRSVQLCLVTAIALTMSRAAGAQVAGASLSGRVVDQAGSAVPGAMVTVSETGTNRSRTAVTDADGVYTVPSLAPGGYRIRVELSGFRTLTRDGIRLSTGETVIIRIDEKPTAQAAQSYLSRYGPQHRPLLIRRVIRDNPRPVPKVSASCRTARGFTRINDNGTQIFRMT
jgi:hypothetical protein